MYKITNYPQNVSKKPSLYFKFHFLCVGVFDPYKYTNQDMCRVMAICYETLLEDEENQVRGVVHYADGSGVSFPHLTLFTPKEAVRIVKNGEVSSFSLSGLSNNTYYICCIGYRGRCICMHFIGYSIATALLLQALCPH